MPIFSVSVASVPTSLAHKCNEPMAQIRVDLIYEFISIVIVAFVIG